MIKLLLKNQQFRNIRQYFCTFNTRVQEYLQLNLLKSQQLNNNLIKENISTTVDQINQSLQNSNKLMLQNFNDGNFIQAQNRLKQNVTILQQAIDDVNKEQQKNEILADCLNLAYTKTNIMLSECYLKQSNYESATVTIQNSLQNLEKMNLNSEQVIICLLDALIQYYQQILYQEFDDKLSKEIEQQILQLVTKHDQSSEIQNKYLLFQIKYLEDDQQNIDNYFNKLDKEYQTLDLIDFLLKKAINRGYSKSALYYCETQLISLIEKYDPNHVIFEATLTNYFALSRENNQTLQYETQLQNLKNQFFQKGFEAFDKIIEFERILQEGLKILSNLKNQETNQLNQIQQLIKELEQIKFSSGTKYHRYAVFMLLGLKRGLKDVQIE